MHQTEDYRIDLASLDFSFDEKMAESRLGVVLAFPWRHSARVSKYGMSKSLSTFQLADEKLFLEP